MKQEQVEKFQSFARTFERHFDLGFNFEIEQEDVELIQVVVAEVERLRKALEQVMEAEEPIMEGWETTTYEIARKALGGEVHE